MKLSSVGNPFYNICPILCDERYVYNYFKYFLVIFKKTGLEYLQRGLLVYDDH